MPARLSRRVLCAALAALLAGCSGDREPEDADIGEAIERMHREWAQAQRRGQKSQVPELLRGLPNVNLAFEANLALRITSVRKLGCKHATLRFGFVCRAVVGASMAGRPPVLQNIQGRFVLGSDGWHARDVVVLDPTR